MVEGAKDEPRQHGGDGTSGGQWCPFIRGPVFTVITLRVEDQLGTPSPETGSRVLVLDSRLKDSMDLTQFGQ